MIAPQLHFNVWRHVRYMYSTTVDADTGCSSSPCINGGSCSNVGDSFQCTCPSGYTGDLCETGMLHSAGSFRPRPTCTQGLCRRVRFRDYVVHHNNPIILPDYMIVQRYILYLKLKTLFFGTLVRPWIHHTHSSRVYSLPFRQTLLPVVSPQLASI